MFLFLAIQRETHFTKVNQNYLKMVYITGYPPSEYGYSQYSGYNNQLYGYNGYNPYSYPSYPALSSYPSLPPVSPGRVEAEPPEPRVRRRRRRMARKVLVHTCSFSGCNKTYSKSSHLKVIPEIKQFFKF